MLRLQQSDPRCHMGVDVMRGAYNFEPQYRVTMLKREDWTKATGAPPAVKGLVSFTDGSWIGGWGDRDRSLWAIGRTKAQVFPG